MKESSYNYEGVQERIAIILKAKGTNVNALSKTIGLAQSTIAGQLEPGKKVKLPLIAGILSTFTDISPDWLIMGTGEMTRTSQELLRTTDQYYALVDSMAELQRKHDAEIQAMITANQRSGSVTLSNIGNTTINNNKE